MKKNVLPLALVLALTAGCAAKPAAPSPTPAAATPAPIETPAAPTPTPLPDTITDAWCAGLDQELLPTPDDAFWDMEDGTLIAYLAQVEEADIGLYSVWFPARNFPELLLRYGDHLQGMGNLWNGFSGLEPAWADFDGGGQEELCVIERRYGDIQTSSLAIYEWDAGWTVHSYKAQDFSAELLELLDFQYTPRTGTVTHGRESAEITLGPAESGRIGLHEDFGDMSIFRLEGTDIRVVFGVGADVNAEVRYFGTLTASVAYDGEGFSLYDIRLLSNSGV